jgi:hypothetical protein
MSDLPFPGFDRGAQSNDAAMPAARPAKILRLDRLPASKAEIREVLCKIYDEAGPDPPNVNRAWDLAKVKLPHARRPRVRDVLKEQEFACRRRKPGKKRTSLLRRASPCSVPPRSAERRG